MEPQYDSSSIRFYFLIFIFIFLDFLTRRILITIYNILTFLSGIKIAYDNNKDNNNINNNNNNNSNIIISIIIIIILNT